GGAAVTSLVVVLGLAVGGDGANDSRAADVMRLFHDMLKDLSSADVETRKKGIVDLNAAAGQTFSAVHHLTQALKDPEPDVRARAARALADAGSLRQAIPMLIVSLRDTNREVRVEAAVALGNIGPLTADVVPALTQALNDPVLEVGTRAATALGIIGPA